jgi:hypothetical protein
MQTRNCNPVGDPNRFAACIGQGPLDQSIGISSRGFRLGPSEFGSLSLMYSGRSKKEVSTINGFQFTDDTTRVKSDCFRKIQEFHHVYSSFDAL